MSYDLGLKLSLTVTALNYSGEIGEETLQRRNIHI
jgi:hypothetical protein